MMQHRHFLALAYSEDGGYGVVFPDIPGCVAEGGTLDDALGAASHVLAFHLDAARTDGETMPQPRSYEQLVAADTDADDWWDWDGAIVAAVAPRPAEEAAE